MFPVWFKHIFNYAFVLINWNFRYFLIVGCCSCSGQHGLHGLSNLASLCLFFVFPFFSQNESELFGRTLHVNLAKPMWHSKNIGRPAWAFEDWLGNFAGSAAGGPTATSEGGAEGTGDGREANAAGGEAQQTFKPNVTLAEVRSSFFSPHSSIRLIVTIAWRVYLYI